MYLVYRRANEKEIINRAVKILKRGGIIVYPTDTVYGLGADATNMEAVMIVYLLKEREFTQPLSAMVSDFGMLQKWAKVNKRQEKILREKLPGQFTFILKPVKPLQVSDGDVGFRIPGGWCAKIAKAFGKPITATSANVHGGQTPKTAKGIEKIFGDVIELYIDGGPLRGKPSTVVDLTGSRPKTVRK